MKRVHLFEFEDLGWFPGFLRNYVTDFLQFLSNKMKVFKGVVPIIEKGLDASGTNQIVDLASGGGGAWASINESLKKDGREVRIVMTDYYPNLKAFEYTKKQSPNLDYVSTPVDARKVPPDLKGLRTQFLSFHHFRPDDAQKILQNAVDSKSAIGIFEGQERSVPSIIAMLLSPISVLLTTPFIRPFSIGRIVFTYLIPIVPLVVLWDGVVSSLRTYSIAEMNEMVARLGNTESFRWEAGAVKQGGARVLYLLGYPKQTN